LAEKNSEVLSVKKIGNLKGKRKEKKMKVISPVKVDLENQENDENAPIQANIQQKDVSPKDKKKGKGSSDLFCASFLSFV
jgi:hypothetical protein